MSFVRSFGDDQFQKMKDEPLFKDLLYGAVKEGDVFPALRKNEFDFYHGGGCLFQYSGKSFKRNPAYDPEIKEKLKSEGKKNVSPISEKAYIERYLKNFTDTKNYDDFKLKNKEHFSKDGKPRERQYLEPLYGKTYSGDTFPKICVLDIEVRFNLDGSKKKCDMALLNTISKEIMFIEAKLFSDPRMSCGENNREPEVIDQVTKYSSLIQSYPEEINEGYKNCIRVTSRLFFNSEIIMTPHIIEDVKLLVYETPCDDEIENNGVYRARKNLKEKIEKAEIDTIWIKKQENLSLNEIWDRFTRKP